jgi:hypothetical protein
MIIRSSALQTAGGLGCRSTVYAKYFLSVRTHLNHHIMVIRHFHSSKIGLFVKWQNKSPIFSSRFARPNLCTVQYHDRRPSGPRSQISIPINLFRALETLSICRIGFYMSNFIFYRVEILLVFSFNHDGTNDSKSDSDVMSPLNCSLQ